MRILAVTNLYPNPLQPNRATFNDQQFRSIAAQCPLAVVSPIAWTDELRARLKQTRALQSRHRVVANGVTVDHPRYVFPPKCFRDWYGHFFQASVKATFLRVLRDFRPDVVLASWAYPDGWAAVRLARQAGLP